MADYIDREELIKMLKNDIEYYYKPCCDTWLLETAEQFYKRFKALIMKTPSVDAVEVVRCRDCKYRKKHLCYTNNVTNDDNGGLLIL